MFVGDRDTLTLVDTLDLLNQVELSVTQAADTQDFLHILRTDSEWHTSGNHILVFDREGESGGDEELVFVASLAVGNRDFVAVGGLFDWET